MGGWLEILKGPLNFGNSPRGHLILAQKCEKPTKPQFLGISGKITPKKCKKKSYPPAHK